MTDPPATIRFLPEFIIKILNGQKTATTRTRPYGAAGDVLDVLDDAGRPQGFKIRLSAVTVVRLGDVPERYHQKEGFAVPEWFIDAWTQIYGSFDPELRVWLHEFEVLPDDDPLIWTTCYWPLPEIETRCFESKEDP